MARDLKSSESNEIVIYDQLSDSKIKFYYKTPTTRERIQYQSAVVNAISKTKSIDEGLMIQLNWADKILTGFRSGDFEYDGKPISSNEQDPNYYAGWRQLLKDTASDMLIQICDAVFTKPNWVVKEDKDFFSLKSSEDTKTAGLTN